MASDVHHPDDFIAYPTNRVVGTIADPTHARAAVEALLRVGFTQQDIDILQGEKDLHRQDSTGTERRFLGQFQRALMRTLADEYTHLRLGEEYKHLQHYIEDVRAGRSVIMVLAKKREKRAVAADILGTHGAELIEFYGRWSWQSLEPNPGVAIAGRAEKEDAAARDPRVGCTYEIDLGGAATHICLDSETRATILRKSTGAPDISHLPVTYLRPQVVMVGWQDADRTTTVHIYDFETGEAHALVGYGERRVHRARGTIRRAEANERTS